MSYWYLATPYTAYPAGHHAAFRLAVRETARLWRAGVPVFSPIAHTHTVAQIETDRTHDFDHDRWMAVDRPLMETAHGLLVVRAFGWEASRGVTAERRYFEAHGRPVIYMDPGPAPIPLQSLATFGPARQIPEAPRAPAAAEMGWREPHVSLAGVPGCVDGSRAVGCPHDQ